MPSLKDALDPKDSVQLLLRRKGKAESGIYKNEDTEIRSSKLPKNEKPDEPVHNP